MLHVGSSRCAPKIKVNVLDGWNRQLLNTAEATPDSGAAGSIMGLNKLESLGGCVENLLKCDDLLVAAYNLSIETVGRMNVVINYMGHQAVESIIVCPEH